MGRIARVGANDKSRMSPRTGPLLDQVHLIALEAPPPFYGIGSRVFFQISKCDRIREHQPFSALPTRVTAAGDGTRHIGSIRALILVLFLGTGSIRFVLGRAYERGWMMVGGQ